MAMQWTILAVTVVGLALGTTGEGEANHSEEYGKDVPLQAKCCKGEKVLPNIFDIKSNNCIQNISITETMNDEEYAKANCIIIDCILRENKMANEDKSVKEQELRMLFMEKAHPDVKEIMEAALNLCFDKHKNTDPDNSPICKSGSQQLMDCITRDVIMKCPESMWDTSRPECGGVEEKKTGSEEENKTED